jgi:predicted ATPase
MKVMAKLKQSVEQLFGAALDLPPERRAAFLDQSCRDAPERRRVVEELLLENDRLGSYLAEPLFIPNGESSSTDINFPILHNLEAGTKLGRYRIIEAIGSGGMGVVYRARDVSLNRSVALKVLSAEVSADSDRLRRFEREALSASALNHPNIVTIYERGEEGPNHYIAMELVQGKTLREVLIAGSLPMQRAIEIAAQIADGLAKAHEAGIAHRDLKPENLMISDDGFLKILDFGLAKLTPTREEGSGDDTASIWTTRPGLLMGTVQYISPEQAAGGPADFRSDQFSLGLVLYEMFTGRRAFQRGTAAETVVAILREQAEPIGVQNPEAPAPLCWAIERCLAKEPDKRYVSTRDLARELATIRDRLPENRSKQVETKLTNLPVRQTDLVGREKEIAAVKEMLLRPGVRLITVTGPGGIGKTRLATQVASETIEQFPAGTHFASLASLRDPGLIASVIAQTLGIREGGAQSPLEALKEALRDSLGGPMLLLLDNFEHLIQAAPTVAELLDIGSSLKILVTSRAALHLYGEHEFPIPPLELPNSRSLPPISALSQYSAIALFVQRAVAVKPDFQLTQENAIAVAEICIGLDGLPLAIELAAARVKVLSPAPMRTRLASRLHLLTGGARDLPQRQQTLRAAIDWSYDLLSAAEQRLFRRLSVFVGGCNLEGAEAVCDTKGDLSLDLLDGMASIVDKSLVQQVEIAAGESRYRMLETIREYALEKLEASGEKAQIKRAHAAYCLVLAEEEITEQIGSGGTEWSQRLATEYDNFRASLDWLTETGDVEWGLRLGSALFRFWETCEYLAEGRVSLGRLLKLKGAGEPTKARARALFSAGVLASVQGDYAAADVLTQESVDIARLLHDHEATAVYLNALAIVARDRGDIAVAGSLFEESLVLWRKLGDQETVARALNNLANTAKLQGDYARARSLYEECLSIFRALGDRTGVAWSMNCQGDVARDQDNFESAAKLYEQGLAVFRELGDRWGIAGTLADLGSLATEERNYSAANSRFRESITIFQQLDHKRGIARLLECFACSAAAQLEAERSLRLAGVAAALRQSIGAPLAPAEQAKLEAALEVSRQALTNTASAAAWLEGWAMPADKAIEEVAKP